MNFFLKNINEMYRCIYLTKADNNLRFFCLAHEKLDEIKNACLNNHTKQILKYYETFDGFADDIRPARLSCTSSIE